MFARPVQQAYARRPVGRAAAIVLCIAAMIAALSLLWIAAELHRSNCQRACSALPWDYGT